MIRLLGLVWVLLVRVQGESHNNSFDIFIFTQHWAVTLCTDWEERDAKHNKCRDIAEPVWTVHGIWPTRWGQIAPNYCDPHLKYNHSALSPIMEKMEQFWPDVEIRGVPDSLWKHEWEKHGTCAVSSPATGLVNQLDYFTAGCRLAGRNPVTDWLAAAGIQPSDTARLTTQQVWGAVLAGTGGARPHIDCVKVEGEVYLSEIKVCYNKNLTALVDCDGIKSPARTGGMMGKCLYYQTFLYPASVAVGGGTSLLAGGVCAALAIATLAITVAFLACKRSRRSRGYESL